jgi:hypothetical protein
MRPDQSLLWTWNRTIDRVPYLLTGVALFLVKYAIDWAVATYGFGQPWSPANYLIWPNDRTLHVLDLSDPDRWFALTMLLVSLPFIWAGVILTVHRLRAAGLPRGLVVFFFVPLVNLLLFLILTLLPTRPPVLTEATSPPPDRLRPLRRAHRRVAGEGRWRSGLVAVAVTVPLALLGVVLGAGVLRSYGFGLFVGAPFALGMGSVLVFGFSRPQPIGECLLVALAATTLAGVGLIAIALEGAICLIMAAPIAYGLSLAGAVVGYLIQTRPWLAGDTFVLLLAVLLALPGLMAAESVNQPEPDIFAVRTEVVVDAPPERVWRHVVSFPPLPEPDDWLSRCGVAYPQRAEIDGTGPGAVRRCVFSTGTFVEPIDAWEEPRLLRFGVTDQPEPMREWSPYSIHPPHLDHYLESRRGQFFLEPLPDGRTRLEGTTWYTNRMWPACYWRLWSDLIIHRIHERVLLHVRDLAEAPDE